MFCFLLTLSGCSETEILHQNFNLDFENINSENILPKDWSSLGDYTVMTDSLQVFSGKYSIKIASTEQGESFGNFVQKIPYQAGYNGKKIQLEGYIKTQNIENGFAGLLLRIDKDDQMLSVENMKSQNLAGTNDWKKYNISLLLPEDFDVIYVAGLLTGNGLAWFDNFTVTIDGIDLQTIPIVENKPIKAELDREFDLKSGFHLDSYNENTLVNLNKLCKTWGYLKYHHPKIAEGDYNWDYELFRILPKIKNDNFDSVLQKWENSFDKTGSHSLTKHYYVGFAINIGNPEFKNENPYPQMDWSDDGYRLLALFRYWSIIEYFFPYKHLTDKNWDEVLVEYIPKILEADDELSYKLTLLQLIGEIQDTHANIWQHDFILDDFFGNNTLPLLIKFVEDKPIVTEVYENYDLGVNIKVGDEVVSIDGIPVKEVIEKIKPYCPASNKSALYRDIGKKLFRTNKKILNVTFNDGKGIFTVNVETIGTDAFYTYEERPSHKELLNGDVGYLYPGNLVAEEIPEIMENFINKKGIIIDFRCYPRSPIAHTLSQYLLPQPTEYAKSSHTSLKNPGTFTFSQPLKIGTDNPDYYRGKVVILVNETTQSSAEFHTMALQVAPKAKVFGSQTAGADGNVSEIYLPGNIRTMISGIGVYYPDGTETQRIGIVPDVEVKPTIQGIRVGKDEVLEAALDYIKCDLND